MVAAGDHILKKVWKNSMWFLCWAHKLHGVGGVTKATETLNDSLGDLFRSPGLVRPSTQAARRRRWRLHHKVERKTTFPPQVGETRWGSWRDAADWYTATWTPWCSFVHAEFFRQMRVPNPANLSDMSTSLADYPLLGLQGVPNVQEDWNVYTRTEKRDIESPEGLVEWWESRQPSAFKDAVLFLILLPSSSGAVERFFSMAGTVTDAQHALSDNLRRMRFMAQFNGDIEERLV